MSSHGYGGPYGGTQLVDAEAAKYIALTVARGVQFMEEKEKWRSRLEALRTSYQKYAESEQNALHGRRLETDLARATIELLAEAGDTKAIVEVYRQYSASGPNFLSKVLELVEVNLFGGNETS